MVATILRSMCKMVGMKRVYQAVIREHFRSERQMLFLMGPRQVGKTTSSRRAGGSRGRHVYLNWDNVDHQALLVAGPGEVAQALELDRVGADKPLLVLGEIHKFEHWRPFLKGFFDTYGSECDVLVTGSARLDVFNVSGDSLMGRYFSYRMHPLSVAELVAPELPTDSGPRAPRPIEPSMWEALVKFGGFPEPLARQEDRFANRWRRLRHQQLLREELRDLTRIQELKKVEVLAQLVIQRTGQQLRYSALATEVGASIDSIKRWLATLESLYYCFRIRPWFRNVARSLRKEPKVFLWDWSLLADPGARFENLVASALLKACHFWTDDGLGRFELHYLRDKDQREVDFLVSRDDQPWLMVETKRSGARALSKSLRHFAERLNVPHALQVAEELPYVDRDVFALDRPKVVPARTFLSQLI